MKAKNKERKEAVRLRKKGLSINEIANQIGVSLSSVSVWVRDVQLTDEQKLELESRNPQSLRATSALKTKYIKLRESYQEEGRQLAKKKEPLHIMGCMLYWAEGSKRGNAIEFGNSDINMTKLFLEFLLTYFDVPKEKIGLALNCYTDNGLTVEEIQSYWVRELGLPKECLKKAVVNLIPKSSKQQKKSKLKYGVMKLYTGSCHIVQHIYGAIQEYGSFEDGVWLTKETSFGK